MLRKYEKNFKRKIKRIMKLKEKKLMLEESIRKLFLIN